MLTAWVPTWRQFADGLTKDMLDGFFKPRGTICLKETLTEDREKELYRAGLRRGQRERRKARMVKTQFFLTCNGFSVRGGWFAVVKLW